MRTRARASLLLVPLSLCLAPAALSGCARTVTREDPQKDTHLDTEPGLFEIEEAAQDFKTKIANYHFPDRVVAKYEDHRVVIQLLRISNETTTHFNVNALADKVRQVLGETDKVVFMTLEEDQAAERRSVRDQKDGDFNPAEQVEGGKRAAAHYSLVGRISDIPKQNAEAGVSENTTIITLELFDKERGVSVPGMTSSKSFRLRKS